MDHLLKLFLSQMNVSSVTKAESRTALSTYSDLFPKEGFKLEVPDSSTSPKRPPCLKLLGVNSDWDSLIVNGQFR